MGKYPGMMGGGTSEMLDESNKGFMMLKKMGWKEGVGLGRYEQGVVEPVRGIRKECFGEENQYV